MQVWKNEEGFENISASSGWNEQVLFLLVFYFRTEGRQVCLKAYRPPLPPPIISSSSKRHYSVLNLSQGLPSSDTTLKVHKLFSKQCLLRGWERTDAAKKT